MPFGPKHSNRPTPKWAANMMDMIAAVLGVVNAWLLTAEYIPHKIADIVGSLITSLLIPISLYLKNWFSSSVSDKTVDVKDVDVIDSE